MDTADIKHRVFAVVLAAGESRRFGSPKQLAEIAGKSLVNRAAGIARDCCNERTILVAGHGASDIHTASAGLCQFLLVNDHYEHGMGSSIAIAARALRDSADALLIMLADQPLVTSHHLHALIDAWSCRADEIVATEFDSSLGPPVLFPRATFQKLQKLTGDQGARHLLSDDQFRVSRIRFDPAAIDVDTQSDLARAKQQFHGQAAE